MKFKVEKDNSLFFVKDNAVGFRLSSLFHYKRITIRTPTQPFMFPLYVCFINKAAFISET